MFPENTIMEKNYAGKSVVSKVGAVLVLIAGLLLGVLFIGRGIGMSQTKDPILKVVAVSDSQPESGKQMYQDYCAVCHGMNGKGNGPAVQFLKTPPPDLTTMDKRYYPTSVASKVSAVLRSGTASRVHGTVAMPLWESLFSSLHGGDQVGALRIRNLSEYVESIQKK